jgi:hypothetical protein
MIKKFRPWLIRRWKWYRHRSLYVIADPADNSITLSRALFDLMDVMSQEQAKVFMFRVGDGSAGAKPYAFSLNPDIKQPTQLCDIQYNSKHRCIGFETLCPTVSRILYDYALPTCKMKLSVEPAVVTCTDEPNKSITYYKILPPHDITYS